MNQYEKKTNTRKIMKKISKKKKHKSPINFERERCVCMSAHTYICNHR